MTRYYSYVYTGENGAYGLTKGRRYNLAVCKMHFYERVLSVYPLKWKIVAFRPFDVGTPLMPYTCEQDFNANWHKCKKKARSRLLSV